MKLIDLLSITDENKSINVYDLGGNKITFYDGKNSIKEEYNNIKIHQVSVKNNVLEITLCIE